MFFGCASMLTHGTISGVRYLSIVHPHRFDWQSRGFVLGLLGINISVAAFFALAPIIGWGRYETFEFGCTLAFHDHSTNVRSYVITALLGVLFIPFAVCLFCYGRITYTAYMCKLQLFRVTTVPSTVKETNPMSTEANPVVKEGNLVDTEGHLIDMETPMMANQTDSMTNINQNANNKKEMEYRPNTFVRQDTHIKREMEYKPTAYAMVDKKLTRLMALTACGYIVAWTPFAMLGIWETFSPPKTIPTQFRVVASLFCKSATAYNPFIYFFMSQGFRADTKAVFQRVISGASSRELDYPHGSSSWTTTSRRRRSKFTFLSSPSVAQSRRTSGWSAQSVPSSPFESMSSSVARTSRTRHHRSVTYNGSPSSAEKFDKFDKLATLRTRKSVGIDDISSTMESPSPEKSPLDMITEVITPMEDKQSNHFFPSTSGHGYPMLNLGCNLQKTQLQRRSIANPIGPLSSRNSQSVDEKILVPSQISTTSKSYPLIPDPCIKKEEHFKDEGDTFFGHFETTKVTLVVAKGLCGWTSEGVTAI